MKKLIFLLLPLSAMAQSPDPCDSLFLQCCIIHPDNTNLLHLEASNHSDDIFDYPGFVLYNTNGDTIAKEIVNYFGIGWNYQPHDLVLYETFTLPFEGVLELYMLFYDTLACTIPISIADTVLTAENTDIAISSIYPNPVFETLHVLMEPSDAGFTISDISGKTFDLPFQRQETGILIEVSMLPPGIYFLTMVNEHNKKNIKFCKL